MNNNEVRTGDTDDDDDDDDEEQVGDWGSEFRCGNKKDSGKCSEDEDRMVQTVTVTHSVPLI